MGLTTKCQIEEMRVVTYITSASRLFCYPKSAKEAKIKSCDLPNIEIITSSDVLFRHILTV